MTTKDKDIDKKLRKEDILTELIPKDYIVKGVLGTGSFGRVYKCVKEYNKTPIAIKIPIQKIDNTAEIQLHYKIRWRRFEECHIVKCTGGFDTLHGTGLIFEKLDMTLDEYMAKSESKPMKLSKIRSIVYELGIALDALGSLGYIHTDVRPDNIMIVKHQRHLLVKLIDFGKAIPCSQAKQGLKLQLSNFKSPEIILGLPFSKAIDMWSLGCVLAQMMLGHHLFPVFCEYNILVIVHELFGQPSDELLDQGVHTYKFYKKVDNKWVFRTPQECSAIDIKLSLKIISLDDLKKEELEVFNRHEGKQREQCVELLKAMLQINGEDRITPSAIGDHPFITGNYPRTSPKRRFRFFCKNNKISPINQSSSTPDKPNNSNKAKYPLSEVTVETTSDETTASRETSATDSATQNSSSTSGTDVEYPVHETLLQMYQRIYKKRCGKVSLWDNPPWEKNVKSPQNQPTPVEKEESRNSTKETDNSRSSEKDTKKLKSPAESSKPEEITDLSDDNNSPVANLNESTSSSDPLESVNSRDKSDRRTSETEAAESSESSSESSLDSSSDSECTDTEDETNPSKDQEIPKAQKKKSVFGRFCSWLSKTFSKK